MEDMINMWNVNLREYKKFLTMMVDVSDHVGSENYMSKSVLLNLEKSSGKCNNLTLFDGNIFDFGVTRFHYTPAQVTQGFAHNWLNCRQSTILRPYVSNM